MADRTDLKPLVCTDSADCPLPLAEHDEDADCLKVAITPPACEHGAAIIECRECAANPPEGWQLVECDQNHPVMWMPDDGWGYPPPCMYCCYDSMAKAHDGCEHAQHGRWRRWKVTHWLVHRAYAIGLVTASGTRWGGGCSRCLTMVRWRGRRPYVLGLPRENWGCLRRGHRRRKVGGGLCGICSPWPCCGAQTYEHAEDCPEVVR